MLRAAFAFLLLLGLAGPALAEKRVALVIGNSAYDDVPQLRNPRNDAEDVSKALARLGFEVVKGLDLDDRAFIRTVSTFSAKLQGADVALLYYSGHGVQVSEQNYLLPVDARVEDEFSLKREGIPLGDILSEMQARAHTNLVFLDACRDNPFAERLIRQSKVVSRSAAVGRGLARIDGVTQDMLMVFATAPGKVAADGTGRNSPFTAAFLQHVSEPGVEIESMMKRVTASVRETTRGTQEPERLSRLSTEFYFAALPPQPAPAPAPDVAKALDTARSIGTAAAYDAFLTSFPTGVYADLARALKAGLATPAPAATPAPPATPAPQPRVATTEPPPPAGGQPETPAATPPPILHKPAPARRPARIVQERRRVAPAPAPGGGGGGAACFFFNGVRTCR